MLRESIRQKLMAMSLSATVGALLLAFVAFSIYDFTDDRASLVRAISTLGEVVGFNAASAMMSKDAATATRNLAALGTRQGILAACIYTRDGAIFARWSRNPADAIQFPAS